MTETPDRFAEKIKKVRKQLVLSQENFAHELGVSFATINRWENGKVSPSRLALKQFKLFCDEMRQQGKIDD